jgi:hypothetical protein
MRSGRPIWNRGVVRLLIVRFRGSQAASVLLLVMLGGIILLSPLSCNSGSRSSNSVTIPRAEYERLQAGESKRFQPFSDGVALDTHTAQLCRTYDWHNRPTRREYLGPVTESPYEKAPLCSVFSQNGSHDAGSITISRAEYERLQAAQQTRFQPFSNLSGVALDGETGQVCKTIDSRAQPGRPPNAAGIPHTGRAPKTASPSSYENAPLCADLRP